MDMFIFDLLLLLIVGTVGFLIGWHAHTAIMIQRLSDNPDPMIEILKKVKESNDKDSNLTAQQLRNKEKGWIELHTEQINSVWFIYEKETGIFLGHGTDLTTTLEEIGNRNPDKTFWCNEPETDSRSA